MEVRCRQHQAADVLKTGRHAEAPIPDKQQSQGDGGNGRASESPMQRLRAVQNQVHCVRLLCATATLSWYRMAPLLRWPA